MSAKHMNGCIELRGIKGELICVLTERESDKVRARATELSVTVQQYLRSVIEKAFADLVKIN